MYGDLSGYEDGDGALVAAPPATTKQGAARSAARLAGRRSRIAQTPPRSTLPYGNGPLVKYHACERSRFVFLNRYQVLFAATGIAPTRLTLCGITIGRVRNFYFNTIFVYPVMECT